MAAAGEGAAGDTLGHNAASYGVLAFVLFAVLVAAYGWARAPAEPVDEEEEAAQAAARASKGHGAPGDDEGAAGTAAARGGGGVADAPAVGAVGPKSGSGLRRRGKGKAMGEGEEGERGLRADIRPLAAAAGTDTDATLTEPEVRVLRVGALHAPRAPGSTDAAGAAGATATAQGGEGGGGAEAPAAPVAPVAVEKGTKVDVNPLIDLLEAPTTSPATAAAALRELLHVINLSQSGDFARSNKVAEVCTSLLDREGRSGLDVVRIMSEHPDARVGMLATRVIERVVPLIWSS